MPLYTAVNDGYDVKVYRTLTAMSDGEANTHLFVIPEGEYDKDVPQAPATATAIRKAMRAHGEVMLSEDGGSEWKRKIVRHD